MGDTVGMRDQDAIELQKCGEWKVCRCSSDVPAPQKFFPCGWLRRGQPQQTSPAEHASNENYALWLASLRPARVRFTWTVRRFTETPPAEEFNMA